MQDCCRYTHKFKVTVPLCHSLSWSLDFTKKLSIYQVFTLLNVCSKKGYSHFFITVGV